MKNGLKTLYGSKLGKLLPVLVIAGLVATASATVFVVYYGSATANVATADIQLVAGSDTSSSSSYAPTVTITNTSDLATISISMLPSVYQNGPPIAVNQPSIFYTDLLEVNNTGAVSHTISSVSITNIANPNSALGEIDVYYCTTSVSTFPSASCAEYSITSTTGGSLTGNAILPQTLTASSTAYIEVVAHANQAVSSGSVTFSVQIQWA